ncbi:DNA topoisomerase III [Acidithiobacillus thiooxidans]|uniref:DNA topoisomerase n=1 Tax=Acidithiobacillus sulfurivorans TaxID=1958756 RepID=A0ABS5ZWP4_9PROT|nr:MULTISPECIES: DNA topoisomerase 3 [Acidithiobacillus]MBU2742908.1 DNA topoisomerase III [Acidithiobacillus albertensis]MBU2759652.1 DNA topoisomerase III [Acidithiobacillus sulfurivorans]MBU2792777.1 DNA topoisomerase III [Acidithiobacillus thiooxidans]
MGLRLVIAEKPSLARAIAEGLGGGTKSGQLEAGGYVITNAFGHILEQAPPDDYLKMRPGAHLDESGNLKKGWRWDDLPIIPEEWIKKPVEKAADQLKKIGLYLKQADLVVHAGDPDREGQLLIDEILEYFHYKGPVQRVWLASMDAASVKKAFATLRDNQEYRFLSIAAECRSRADWLIGMNLSRAWTIRNHQKLSVGRVQTPTLALVVQRDLEIEAFRPKSYYEVVAHLSVEQGLFKARWKPSAEEADSPAFDTEGRLIDKTFADRVAAAGKAASKGTVAQHQQQDKTSQAPLPFSLSALQKTASARWGISAKGVLDACQSLYEKKLTTYPRTDCRYLPEEQFVDAARIIGSLQEQSFVTKMVDGTELSPGRKHAAWNTGKITAHHAIIPTGARPSSLDQDETHIYHAICQSYLALFAPPEKYKSTQVVVHLGLDSASAPMEWVASGKRVIDPGWKRLFGAEDAQEEEEGDDGQIPPMQKGDPTQCQETRVVSKETRPPARFTDGTLIDAMSNIHKMVQDPEARARLKENAGIGTEATRAAILETLNEKGFIQSKGKQLISTPLGRAFIAKMTPTIKDPVMTARWESVLDGISAGKVEMRTFMAGIEKQVTQSLENVPCDVVPNQHVEACPICAAPFSVLRKESTKKAGNFYWVCDNPDRPHEKLSDDNGRPGKPFEPRAELPLENGDGPKCPKCKIPTFHMVTNTEKKKPYWRCRKCSKSWWPGDPDTEGKPTLGTAWPSR